MKKVTIYTDGACSGNPGPGGWGAILMFKNNKKEISGFQNETTNNQMELLAIIQALKCLKEQCDVEIYSDSAYVVNSFIEDWVTKWVMNNWKTSSNKPVLNIELWKDLLEETNKHKVKWFKVKGHSDNEFNNRCDQLARKEIENNTKKTLP